LAHSIYSWVQGQSSNAHWPVNERLSFVETHPDWPAMDICINHMEKVAFKTNSMALTPWFEKHPPVTEEGVLIYAAALMQKGKTDKLKKLIQNAWHTQLLKSPRQFYAQFKKLLSASDHIKRLDLLLRTENLKEAEWLTNTFKLPHHTKHRILINKGSGKHSSNPRDFATAYELIRHHRKSKNNYKAYELLSKHWKIPESYTDLMWRERNLIARRFIEDGDYKKAYETLKDHQLTRGEHFANATFLMGWIALTFLKQPQTAAGHFKTLYNNVTMPLSKTRAAYWCALALEKIHPKESKEWFKKAATHPEAYYGQLALFHLPHHHDNYLKTHFQKKPVTNQKAKARFDSRLMVKAVRFMHKMKARDTWMEAFLNQLAKNIESDERPFLLELSNQSLGHYGSVLISKKTQHLDSHFYDKTYPVINKSTHHHNLLTHSLMRQESLFNAKALSHMGAMGLMQLMPKTAKETAKRHKIKYRDLFCPNNSLTIGQAHIKDLVKDFDGDLVLAIASYNAGKTPILEWIETMGHPKDIGYVQWIEMIPYYETRNYVQRVLENMNMYSYKLGKKTFLKDIIKYNKNKPI
jgi:soluble lytic murein transglycosylase